MGVSLPPPLPFSLIPPLLALAAALALELWRRFRRTRSDVARLERALRTEIAREGSFPDAIKTRTRAGGELFGALAALLQRNTHRVRWMHESLGSLEDRLEGQAEIIAQLLSSAEELQKSQGAELQESLSRIPRPAGEGDSGGPARGENSGEAEESLRYSLERIEGALQRALETTRAITALEECAARIEGIAPRLESLAEDSQILSLNASLAVSDEAGETGRAVTENAQSLERQAQEAAEALLQDLGRLHERATEARAALQSENHQLLEGAQHLEQAQKILRRIAEGWERDGLESEERLQAVSREGERAAAALAALESGGENARNIARQSLALCVEAAAEMRRMRQHLALLIDDPGAGGPSTGEPEFPPSPGILPISENE